MPLIFIIDKNKALFASLHSSHVMLFISFQKLHTYKNLSKRNGLNSILHRHLSKPCHNPNLLRSSIEIGNEIYINIIALTQNSPLISNLSARPRFSLINLGSLSSKENEFKISISFRLTFSKSADGPGLLKGGAT